MLFVTSCSANASYSENEYGETSSNRSLVIGEEASGRRLLQDGKYYSEVEGAQGKMVVEMRVRDGFIDRIDVVKHNENVGIVEAAFDKLKKEMIKKQSAEVDSIAGATESSDALKDAVRECIRQAKV